MDLDQERAFIQKIVEGPDDDTPRLAYAHWLEQHGQKPRARLIQLQCSIETMKSEVQELLERHGHEWAGPVWARGADRWTFHRGFPEEIYVPRSDILLRDTNFAEMLERSPITRLHINPSDSHLVELCGRPELRYIRSLDLGSPDLCQNFSTVGIDALCHSQFTRDLQVLTIHPPAGMANQIVPLIAQSPGLQGLRQLSFFDPSAPKWPGPDVIRQIVQSPTLTNLGQFQWNPAILGSKTLDHYRRTLDSADPSRGGTGR